MKRVAVPELLDTDAGTPGQVAASLADLRWFNRWFGGTPTTTSLIAHVARTCGATDISALEVAAGSGYLAGEVQRRLSTAGIRLQTTLLDRLPAHMSNNGHFRRVAANALALPFRDASFDVVASNLFLHHLEPAEVVTFADDSLRVARRAVVINDLRRHSVHYGLALAGIPLYRSRLTRNDAPASVRRAYTVSELRDLLRQTPATRVEITYHYLFRMGIILWK